MLIDDCITSDPLRLSHFLLRTCRDRGVQLHQNCKPLGLELSSTRTIEGLRITSPDESTRTSIIPCNRVIITAGAWTPRIFSKLFPESQTKIPITSLAGHSLLLKSPRWQIGQEKQGGEGRKEEGGCHAVFTTDPTGYSPEVFSRVGGEIWIGGLNDPDLKLPEIATDRKIDPESIATLQATAKRMLGDETGSSEDLEILKEGLCFRPVTSRGIPIIDELDETVTKVKTKAAGLKGEIHPGGVWLAAGHGPWGISLSLGTGKCLAEMVDGKKTSARIADLSL